MLKRMLIIFTMGLSVSLLNPVAAKADDIDEIAEEIKLGEMELLAQLIQAEAGNQSLTGKRLVADVVINRTFDSAFPDTIEEVIFQKGQFTCVNNGGFSKAGWTVTPEDYLAAELEYNAHEYRINRNVLYFSRGKGPGTEFFKEGDHWFSY